MDWAIHVASQRPGPQDYDSDAHRRVSGGRFSTARPKSALDVAIDSARQSPGPGEYNSDISSIGRRTGDHYTPSTPTAPPRPRSAPGIPPEARGVPKPKNLNDSSLNSSVQTPKQHRPQTSIGIPPEARRTPRAPPALPPRATSAPPGPRGPQPQQNQTKKTINVNLSASDQHNTEFDKPSETVGRQVAKELVCMS